MEPNELAKEIDGIEYPPRFEKKLLERAAAARLVIVYGASDDLLEFYGAIDEEAIAAAGWPKPKGPDKATVSGAPEIQASVKRELHPESRTGVPVMRSTNEAFEFGRGATAEQLAELEQLAKSARERARTLLAESRKEGDEEKLNQAMQISFEAQFFREAGEAAATIAAAIMAAPPWSTRKGSCPLAEALITTTSSKTSSRAAKPPKLSRRFGIQKTAPVGK